MTQGKNEGSGLDLGFCSEIRAESIGEPGHRHFRVLAKAEYGSVILWLEKEDLFELAMTIKRLSEIELGRVHNENYPEREMNGLDYE